MVALCLLVCWSWNSHVACYYLKLFPSFSSFLVSMSLMSIPLIVSELLFTGNSHMPLVVAARRVAIDTSFCA